MEIDPAEGAQPFNAIYGLPTQYLQVPLVRTDMLSRNMVIPYLTSSTSDIRVGLVPKCLPWNSVLFNCLANDSARD